MRIPPLSQSLVSESYSRIRVVLARASEAPGPCLAWLGTVRPSCITDATLQRIYSALDAFIHERKYTFGDRGHRKADDVRGELISVLAYCRQLTTRALIGESVERAHMARAA